MLEDHRSVKLIGGEADDDGVIGLCDGVILADEHSFCGRAPTGSARQGNRSNALIIESKIGNPPVTPSHLWSVDLWSCRYWAVV